MKEFEIAFQKELKDETSISEKSRVALDDAYSQILASKSTNKHKFARKQKLLTAAVIILIIGALGSLTFTPLTEAFSKLLNLGNFSSQKLIDSGFVTSQTGSAKEKSVKVSLEELFIDQKQIGLHLTVKLPEDSPLLDKDMEDYSLQFALVNGDGIVIADINNSLKKGDLLDAITYQAQSYKEEGVIDFTFQLTAKKEGIFPTLKDAQIKVTEVSALKRNTSPGIQQNESANITGVWNIPIDSKDIQELEPISYISDSTAKNKLDVINATAYPSSFVISFKNNQKLQQYFAANHDGSIPEIQVTNNQKTFSYRLLQASSAENDQEYVLRFEYGSYADFSTIKILLPTGDKIKLVRK